MADSGVRKTNQGAALLAVLWLAAGLSAIALTIANTVRGETERSSTEADGLKAYYLAAGAIDRMLLYLEKPASFLNPDKTPLIKDYTRVLGFDFPTGVVMGEIIPETSKLDVNTANPKDLLNLLLALGDVYKRQSELRAVVCKGKFPGLRSRNGLVEMSHRF